MNKPTNILAIDTSGAVFSAALACGGADGRERWYFEADAGTRHAQLVMEITDYLLTQANLKREDLHLAVCMAGPGSFTGLRIGYATVKGLALALDIPFAPVPTLDCMAQPYSFWPGLVIPAIDAKKNAYFCALYHGGKRICPDMDAEPQTIAQAIIQANNAPNSPPALLVGNDAPSLYENLINGGFPAPGLVLAKNRAGWAKPLLAIAESNAIAYTENSDFALGPEYIRKSDAELNLEK